MSNALTDARVRLTGLLTDAGLNAFIVAPTPATPPFAYVGPNEPYLDFEGANFGCVIARFQVGYIARPGVNETAAEDVDDGVLKVLAALADSDEFSVESVGRPGQITLAGQGNHIAVPVDVAIELEL